MPDSGGPGQQCTYGFGGALITGGLAAGTPDQVSPGRGIQDPLAVAGHILADVLPFDDLSCEQYLDAYPPNNANSCLALIVTAVPDDSSNQSCKETVEELLNPDGEIAGESSIPPVTTESLVPGPASYTDPHLITIDGLNYSFQAVGEFILAKSEIDNLEIQSRQSRYGGPNSQVSVNTGFGFNVNGARVSIVKSPSGDTVLFIDDLEQAQIGDIRLDSGGLISVTANSLQLVWPDGSIAIVADRGNFMNLSLALSSRHQGRITGLLGNFDGEVENDIVTSSGEDLSTQASANDIYGIFADGWRITDEISLLFYYDGQDTEFFTDRLSPGRSVSISDLDDSTRATAEQVCRTAGVINEVLLEDCILDVGFSGDSSFADAINELQGSLIDGLTDADIQGELDVPTLACDEASQNFYLEGLYTGTFTNPDIGITWNSEFMLSHCGDRVIGVNKNTNGDAFSNRRFEGTLSGDEIAISFGYPYNSDFTSFTGIINACENMTASLFRVGSILSGAWASPTSGCGQGGVINLTRSSESANQTLYLNIDNMDVSEGINSTPSLNNTISLNNVIDAATAETIETHTQTTHIWHTGSQLELDFDLRREYILEEIHFWNFFDEAYDVDGIELSFRDSSNIVIGEMSLARVPG